MSASNTEILRVIKEIEKTKGTAQLLVGELERGREVQASRLSARFRRQRNESVSHWEFLCSVDWAQDELTLKKRANALQEELDAFELFLEQWRKRALPEEILVQSEDGRSQLADAMLPAEWSYKCDIVILMGPGLSGIAHALRAHGQQRIFAIASPAESHAAYPLGTLFAEGEEAATRQIAELGTPIARRAAYKELVCLPQLRARREKFMTKVLAQIEWGHVNQTTISFLGTQWVEQGLTNLGNLAHAPSLALLDDAFVGKPMIVVAPGPSLGKNIDLIAALQGKAIIVTFSHTLVPLQRAGVSPDFVLIMDPQDLLYHFEGADPTTAGTLLVSPVVDSRLFDLGFAHTLTFTGNAGLEGWLYQGLEPVVELPGGGSVATHALTLAAHWRCESVAFVGLDLSYPDGRTYVEGSSDSQQRVELDDSGTQIMLQNQSEGWLAIDQDSHEPRTCLRLPGYESGTVMTDAQLFQYHQWFSEKAELVLDEELALVLYNCTEGGAHIPGMQHIPLAQWIERCEGHSVDTTAIVAKRLRGVDFGARAEILARRVRSLRSALSKSLALARTCRSQLRKKASLSSGKLAKVERKLRRVLRHVPFLSLMANEAVRRARKVGQEKAGLDLLAEKRLLMDAVIQSCIDAIARLDQTACPKEDKRGQAA